MCYSPYHRDERADVDALLSRRGMEKYLVSLRKTGLVWEGTVFERLRGSYRVTAIVTGSLPFVQRESLAVQATGAFDPPPASAASARSSGMRKLRRD